MLHFIESIKLQIVLNILLYVIDRRFIIHSGPTLIYFLMSFNIVFLSLSYNLQSQKICSTLSTESPHLHISLSTILCLRRLELREVWPQRMRLINTILFLDKFLLKNQGLLCYVCDVFRQCNRRHTFNYVIHNCENASLNIFI